jgi:cyclopropane fatty-acyl-phospholipid synthase-like methyltransferase
LQVGVQVWATDLWCNPSENWLRIQDADLQDGVFPLKVEARNLPFPNGFFDAIVSIDSFPYYGTDDLYLAYLAKLLKPEGFIGIAGAALLTELNGPIPEALAAWWEPEMHSLHSPAWWRNHWEKSGLVEVQLADAMPDGWLRWLEWHHFVAPDNKVEIEALEKDQGNYLGYMRAVAKLRPGVKLAEPVLPMPSNYTHHPLLR